jgi:hypothetical protein
MDKQILCECGHLLDNHLFSNSPCRGDKNCPCCKSRQQVQLDYPQLVIAAYEEALKKIVAKSEKWQDENDEDWEFYREYTEPPWWNLGDIAKAALVKFGDKK